MLIALPHRTLIRFANDDAAPFLNDLITAEVPNAKDGLRPAALLTPQGRILFDFLISRGDDDSILIEIDRGRGDAFMKKMKMYRLRRDVAITEDGSTIFAVIDDANIQGMIRDTRFPANVFRFYGHAPDAEITADIGLYNAYRYRHGVPEGAEEMPPEKALPLEARLDLNHGISFEKGCYIGQEVTARTRYRGLVKRSYLPVILPEGITAPQDIKASGKLVGELLAAAPLTDGAIGLANIRLDAFDSAAALTINDSEITAEFPERLMPLPKRKTD